MLAHLDVHFLVHHLDLHLFPLVHFSDPDRELGVEQAVPLSSSRIMSVGANEVQKIFHLSGLNKQV